MKKVIYIFVITFLVVACSKDDTKSDASNLNNYQAKISTNFTDPFKRLENIQVGDTIPFLLTIEDKGDCENVEYRLASVYKSSYNHQNIWKDFGIYQKKDTVLHSNRERNYLSFYNTGKYEFYIRPFVPGTFKLHFELQKIVNGKVVGSPTQIEVIFIAVEISLGGKRMKSYDPVPKYFYYININSGNEIGDNYLSIGEENTIQICKVSFILNGKEMIAEEYLKNSNDNRIDFATSISDGSPFITIKHIRITRKIHNLPDFVIEYHNLNLSQYVHAE